MHYHMLEVQHIMKNYLNENNKIESSILISNESTNIVSNDYCREEEMNRSLILDSTEYGQS